MKNCKIVFTATCRQWTGVRYVGLGSTGGDRWTNFSGWCYESFWFTKLGLVCSPGLAASKIFNNFLSLLIPLIDTGQTHCCRRYVTWINVANQITIWYEDFYSLRVLLVYQIRTRLFPWARSIKNFQQFSESIDTINWYRANTLLPTLHHVNKCGKSDNNMIWGFLLMTYNWLIIAVRFTIQGQEKETFKWYLGWSHWVLQAKIHSPQHM